MKLIKNSIYALSMVSLMGLWSCSQDEMLKGGTDLQGHPVTLTLTVNRSDAQTRTQISENEQAGLTSVWEKDKDVLHVYDAKGKDVGTLKIDEIVSPSVAVFSGTVEAVDGESTYNIWYYPEENDNLKISEGLYGNTTLVVDLNNQNFTSAADFAKLEILSKEIKLNVQGKNATVTKDEEMKSRMSFARFSLAGIDGKKGNLEIYNAVVKPTDGEVASYTNFIHTLTFDTRSPGIRPGQADDANHHTTIQNMEGGKDVYIALAPGSAYTLAFVFTATDGSKYTFNYTKATEIKEGKYYNDGFDNGSVKGAEITLVPVATSAELHFYANFDGADPEKIVMTQDFSNGQATFDLTKAYTDYVDNDGKTKLPIRVTYDFIGWANDPNATIAETSVTVTKAAPTASYYAIWKEVDQAKNPLNKWAENNLVHNENSYVSSFGSGSGSLYQWGRNHGFTDYNDARGTLTTYGTYGYYYWGYAAVTDVNDYSTSQHAGTDIHAVSGNFIEESFLVPETANDIKDFPKMYIMNAFVNNNTGDYWIFNGGGSDWYTRAAACGYDVTNPAPENWRLPTTADFKEITPAQDYSGTVSLSELLNDKLELKTITVSGKTYNYAIRWINTSSDVKIQAINTGNLITKNNIAEVDWKDAKVVERVFPYTGKIKGYNTGMSVLGGMEYVARPMPLGSYDRSTKKIGNYYQSATILTVMVNTNANAAFGGYWVSDSKSAFVFLDNSKTSLNANSYMKLVKNDAHDGLAIRCVRADM